MIINKSFDDKLEISPEDIAKILVYTKGCIQVPIFDIVDRELVTQDELELIDKALTIECAKVREFLGIDNVYSGLNRKA